MRFTQAWHSFFDRSTPNVVLRLIVMLVGVAITSASVALTRATGLGTSPVSCFPATLSYLTPLTIGTWTFIMNVVFVLIQIALLRRDFNPVQLLQIPYVFVFGTYRCIRASLRAHPHGKLRAANHLERCRLLHDSIRRISAGKGKFPYPTRRRHQFGYIARYQNRIPQG